MGEELVVSQCDREAAHHVDSGVARDTASHATMFTRGIVVRDFPRISPGYFDLRALMFWIRIHA